MANLTFTDLQNDVFAHTGLDGSDVTTQTNVKRWINYVQQDLCSRWPWSFLEGRESIATIPDYSTGTVSVNSGSTTVTAGGSASFTAAHGDGTYFIQFSSANDWYRVSASTPTTALTLEKAYQPSTNLSAGTYTLRKFFYSLSSSADEVLDVRNWNTPVKLIQVDFRTIDLINPLVQSTNAPYAYLMFGTDASGNQVFSPYPFPTDARLFEFRTRKRPTDMSAPTDPPSIPNKYAQLLIFGANAVAFAFLRKMDMADAWNAKFEARLSDMKKEYRQSGDYQPILGSIDTISRGRWIQFPTQYPTVTNS
jgi:hypothetical protein